MSWYLDVKTGRISCYEPEKNDGDFGGRIVSTFWDTAGKVALQRLRDNRQTSWEYRNDPPWWPHPPLIDLREFEE